MKDHLKTWYNEPIIQVLQPLEIKCGPFDINVEKKRWGTYDIRPQALKICNLDGISTIM